MPFELEGNGNSTTISDAEVQAALKMPRTSEERGEVDQEAVDPPPLVCGSTRGEESLTAAASSTAAPPSPSSWKGTATLQPSPMPRCRHPPPLPARYPIQTAESLPSHPGRAPGLSSSASSWGRSAWCSSTSASRTGSRPSGESDQGDQRRFDSNPPQSAFGPPHPRRHILRPIAHGPSPPRIFVISHQPPSRP